MSRNPYIGRGENTVGHILKTLFGGKNVYPQFQFKHIVHSEEYKFYDSEVQKHNFDFYVTRAGQSDLIVEVNYKHGAKADYKWNNIFSPIMLVKNIIPITIEDRECPHLFKQQTHPIDLNDWIEVLSELKRAGVQL